MGIDIGRLEDQLLLMSAEVTPGREFCEAVSELARTGQIRTRYRNAATLGNLLHEVNNNLQRPGFNADFLRVSNQVNDIGRKAVHQGLLSEDEARSCLQNARQAMQLLLRN